MQEFKSRTGLAIAMTVEAGEWEAGPVLRGLVESAVSAAWDQLSLPQPARSELSLVFTDDAGIRAINAAWRGVDKPTNVLSFPGAVPFGGAGLPPLLGDIVLAEETLRREAGMENRPVTHHLLHLIVHGLLHLLGYDHQEDEEAERMEGLEARILARLNVPDPYHGNSNDQDR